MKLGKRLKRLTRLKVNEISAVDRGAGEGVHIVLAKRQKPRYRFNDAGSLVPVDKVNDSVERALAEIAEHRAVVKAAAPLTEDHPMETSEVIKAAVAKVDDRIAAIIAKSDKPIDRVVAIGRMASSSDPRDIEAWQIHKQLATVPATPVSAPALEPVSDAYAKMMRKAAKLAQKEGISQASAFAKIYQSRPDLAQQDKAHFFNRAG
jgi:NADH dehydrogenase/NADH:ubiquinone oxidoreductase subunit G